MLHQKLQELRTECNLSQEELANAIGISRVAISQIELGERSVKAEELKKFADVFEVDVNDLLAKKSTHKEAKLNPKDKHYKLKELILYLSSRLMSKQNFGETLLNKLLYFIDFDYYERTGALITDEEYVKLPYGPVPKAMKQVIDEMEANGQIKIVSRNYFGKVQKTLIPLVESNIRFLNEVWEINNKSGQNYTPYEDVPHPQKVIEDVLEKYGSRNADAMTSRSHNDMPYQATKKIGEKISPGLVFYRSPGYVVNPHNLFVDEDE